MSGLHTLPGNGRYSQYDTIYVTGILAIQRHVIIDGPCPLHLKDK